MPAVPDSFFFFSQLKDAHVQTTQITIAKVEISDSDRLSARVHLHSPGVSAYVFVQTTSFIGYFDLNAFIMLPGTKELIFTSRDAITDEKAFTDSIKVRTLADTMA